MAVNVNLSETALLEHGTIRALLSHLTGNRMYATPNGKGRVVAAGSALCVLEPLALSGWSARWPGGVSAQLHSIMHASGDAVSSIPLQRWSPTGSLDHLSSQQNESVQHGGFLAGAQEFDHCYFGVSPVEAAVIDPQHRLLLEVGYSSLRASSMRRAVLMRSETGVYLGIMNVDYQLQGRAAHTAFATTSRSISIAAGRLSFTLGLNGPSQSVDIGRHACSGKWDAAG
jgi:acyl transferase domain-containing protein